MSPPTTMLYYIKRTEKLRRKISVVDVIVDLLDEYSQTDSGWRPGRQGLDSRAVGDVKEYMLAYRDLLEKEVSVIAGGPPETVADRLKKFKQNGGRPKKKQAARRRK